MSAVPDVAAQQPPRAKTSTTVLLDSPDQGRVRADLTDFFGPSADVFLDTYEKMRSATGGRRSLPHTWNWAVFFGSFTWFFYRKLYALGATVIFLPLVLGYLFGTVGSSIPVLFAVWAKGFYVQTALSRILKADKLGLAGAERSDYLRRAGGVSVVAGVFAGVLYLCLLALVIWAAMNGHRAGR